MTPTYDIIVIGAGIIGCACTEQCASAGLKVLILDRGPVGVGTTGAAMGHIVIMDDSADQLSLTRYGRRLWSDLAKELPANVEYLPCGTLWVAADDEEQQEVLRKAEVYRQAGARVQVLSGKELRQLEPNLRHDLAGALRVSEDAVLYPPNATRFLLARALDQGATLRLGAEVKHILPEGTVTLTDGSRLSAGLIIIAAGCLSPALSPGLPVRARKGHLVITDRYPGLVHHQIVELGYLKSAHAVSADSVAFNIQPRPNGQLLIGSSRQYGDESQEVNPHILSRMLNRVRHYMPCLDRLSAVRTWVGFRPATPDKRPLIGPSLVSNKIWLATGHEGLGVTMAPATGKLIADMIMGRTSAIPTEPYLPARLKDGEAIHV